MPTEIKATQEELKDFYAVLKQTLETAEAKVGKEQVLIAGDFNMDLASAARELLTTERLLGGCMKEGNGSENSNLLIDFCTANKLAIPQTFGRRSEAAHPLTWETASRSGHVKDLILIPRSNKMYPKMRSSLWRRYGS